MSDQNTLVNKIDVLRVGQAKINKQLKDIKERQAIIIVALDQLIKIFKDDDEEELAIEEPEHVVVYHHDLEPYETKSIFPVEPNNGFLYIGPAKLVEMFNISHQRIFRTLLISEEPMSIREIARHRRLMPVTVTPKLAYLFKSKVIIREKRGREFYFSLPKRTRQKFEN